MAEAAFSEDGKYYSAISGDGRLKIWDTETSVLKQEYTPDLHLTAPPSCLQWITVTQTVGQSQKQGKKRASISETESQCIALGTTNGKILIYSVAQAKIQVVLQKKNSQNKITALDWHRKYGLYSCCARDNSAIEWDLQTAGIRNSYNVAVDSKSKQGNNISAIKIVPHSLETKAHYLVTASWQVRLWRLCGGDSTVVKTLGHNASQTAVLAVATLKDNCWLIEGSQNERLLSFWDITITEDHQPQVNGDEITPTKKKRKKSLTDIPTITNASYNFVLEDAPRIVDVELKEEEGAMRLSLAAATRSGVVHYYGHMLNGSSIKPLKPSVTLQATTADAAPLPLQCCRLKGTGDLLLGYTQGPLMTFETVTPDLKTKTQVLIRGETKLQKKAKQSQNQNNETNKVRSDPRSANAQVLEPMGGVATRKRVAPGAQVEIPMEARLANLSLDVKGRSKSAVNQNLTKLLVQGLHSKDRSTRLASYHPQVEKSVAKLSNKCVPAAHSLRASHILGLACLPPSTTSSLNTSILKLVLQKNDPAVATRTVAALPAEYVPLLLDHLVGMATRKTSLCAVVCTWLQALTLRHAALLLALSPQADQLTRLLAVFTQRRSHLCQLMNLKGRVELTAKQRTASQNAQDDQNAVLDYNDDSSSDEEQMKIEKYKSESEESWGDDKFESGGDEEMEQGDDSDSSSDDDEEE